MAVGVAGEAGEEAPDNVVVDMNNVFSFAGTKVRRRRLLAGRSRVQSDFGGDSVREEHREGGGDCGDDSRAKVSLKIESFMTIY